MIRVSASYCFGIPAIAAVFSVAGGIAAFAAASGSAPQPYFVSIKVDEAYMREGPSDMHRVKWIYRRKGLPLEVIATFDVWRRVRDMDGEVGWMHMALLTRDRTAVVTGGTGPVAEVRARDDTTSDVVARAQPGAIGRLLGCGMLACQVEFTGAEGWVERARLWGIHGGEEY
jgi:SH3-like domain-containing protein